MESWLAEYYWSEHHPGTACQAAGNGSTGILISGEDNYVSNVIVFDFTCTGVLVDGGANILQGVHSWNGGGVAISVNGSYDVQDRVLACYLDYSTLTVVNPRMLLAQGNFFYNAHAVLVGSEINNVVFRENVYSLNQYGGNASIVLQPAAGPAPPAGISCSALVVEDEINALQDKSQTALVKVTSASATLHQTRATLWTFDFGASLLLPRIDAVRCEWTH